MQGKILMGAGIHSKMFKLSPTEMIFVMSNRRESDIDAAITFFEIDQAKYVKYVDIVNYKRDGSPSNNVYFEI